MASNDYGDGMENLGDGLGLRFYLDDTESRKRVEELRGKRFLTIAEFAECIGREVNTIRRWCRQGCLKSRLMGPGDRRLPRSELDKYERGDMMQER
jgi:excisionase family DNA binding protein